MDRLIWIEKGTDTEEAKAEGERRKEKGERRFGGLGMHRRR